MQTARVDRLLRSLVGVVDLRPVWTAGGALAAVHVLGAAGVRGDQLVRNVVSALEAGLGVRIRPAAVRVHATPDAFLAACPPPRPQEGADGDATAAPAAAAPAASGAAGSDEAGNGNGHHGNGNGNGHHGNGNGVKGAAAGNGHAHGSPAGGNGNGHGAAARTGPLDGVAPAGLAVAVDVLAAVPPDAGYVVRSEPAADDTARRGLRAGERVRLAGSAPAAGAAGPLLEVIDLERVGAMLRCRVTLLDGTARYSGVADAPARAGAEQDLAARVALDALRAGGFTAARLDGTSRTTIGRHTYLVATVREPAADAPVAGAARIGDCAARAAVEAVINAVAPRGAGSRIIPAGR